MSEIAARREAEDAALALVEQTWGDRSRFDAVDYLIAALTRYRAIEDAAEELNRWVIAERMFMPHQSEWTLDRIYDLTRLYSDKLDAALKSNPTDTNR